MVSRDSSGRNSAERGEAKSIPGLFANVGLFKHALGFYRFVYGWDLAGIILNFRVRSRRETCTRLLVGPPQSRKVAGTLGNPREPFRTLLVSNTWVRFFYQGHVRQYIKKEEANNTLQISSFANMFENIKNSCSLHVSLNLSQHTELLLTIPEFVVM